MQICLQVLDVGNSPCIKERLFSLGLNINMLLSTLMGVHVDYEVIGFDMEVHPLVTHNAT